MRLLYHKYEELSTVHNYKFLKKIITLKREAHKHEMNVSEYIRYLIEKERKKCNK